ncbi:MAG: hypothetical protein ABL996_06850 [Micropepsaceae bacterium]
MSKFASLTAGLLARKGEAEPVVTPFADQLLTRVGSPDAAADIRTLTPMPHPHIHLHVEPGAVKKPPAVKPLCDAGPVFGAFGKRMAEEIARSRRNSPHPAADGLHAHDDEDPVGGNCGTCVEPIAEESGKTFHVNLRMKRPRFVKLKLSAALLRKPVQDIVAEALDAWFERLPPDVLGDCACMKARAD